MNYLIQSLKYFILRRILRRKYITAQDTQYDLSFQCVAGDGMARKIYKRGSLDPEYMQHILKIQFKDDDIILDIGANMGWFSVVIGSKVPLKIKIFSFEPELVNFELLKKNVANNSVQCVEPINKAVAEKSGVSTLFLYHPKNTGRHSLLDINPETGKSIQIETIQLDEFLADRKIAFERVKFVKIDIEGYEFFALKGGMKLLEHLPYMFLEFSPASIKKGGQSPADFIRWLQQFKFKFYNLDGGKATAFDLEYLTKTEKTENLFMVKEGHDFF